MTDTPAQSLTGRVQRFGRRHALTPIALGVLLYSTGPVFVRASSVSGAVFSLYRLWLGVAVFALVLIVRRLRNGPLQLAPGVWRWPLLAGIAFGSHQLLLFTAVKLTSVADVTLIGATSPIVTGLMAIPFFHERPGTRFRLWSLVAMVGSAVVVFGGATGPRGDPLGMSLALVNVVLFAAFFLLSKRSRDHIGVMPFLAGVMLVAALLVSGYVAVAGEAPGTATGTDILYAAIVAAGPGFFGHVVMTWPLQWIPANVPPVMRLGIPVLAATWAWLFLGEGVDVLHVVGGAITVAGVAGAVLSRQGRDLVAREQMAAGTGPGSG